MTSVHITASRSYDVRIERGLLDRVGDAIREVCGESKVVLVTDDTVRALYASRVLESLARAGISAELFSVSPGEGAKSLSVYARLLSFLSEQHMTRTDVLAALGGGVVGDLTGFAAATFQRGIRFVQIPTTLLADVDSSVGGKTAVNLPTGKNQVGCFYQPHLVLCDPDALDTLPQAQYLCGCAEVLKYGVLGSAEFFRSLRQTPVSDQIEDVIATCVRMKSEIVQSDEFDRGQRQLLNLGHSFGHAVEACSGFSVLHGQAVAIGMAIIARAGAKRGVCPAETAGEILAALEQYHLPTSTEFSADELFSAIFTDKKLTGKTMHLVVPEEIGRCRILPVPVEDVRGWIADGLS